MSAEKITIPEDLLRLKPFDALESAVTLNPEKVEQKEAS